MHIFQRIIMNFSVIIFLCFMVADIVAAEKQIGIDKKNAIMERYAKTKALSRIQGIFYSPGDDHSLSVDGVLTVELGKHEQSIEKICTQDCLPFLEKKVNKYQWHVLDKLMTGHLYSDAQQLTTFIPPYSNHSASLYARSCSSFSILHYCTILNKIEKRGGYGWTDSVFSVPKSSLYQVIQFLVMALREEFFASKAQDLRNHLIHNHNVLRSLITTICWHYGSQDERYYLEGVYDCYLDLFLKNIPHDEQTVTDMLKKAREEASGVLRHMHFHVPLSPYMYLSSSDIMTKLNFMHFPQPCKNICKTVQYRYEDISKLEDPAWVEENENAGKNVDNILCSLVDVGKLLCGAVNNAEQEDIVFAKALYDTFAPLIAKQKITGK